MPNLVGIGNSQVPTNAMLGGLAYQDSVGEIDIDKIKARTSDTAVDVFVYDTRKDSDGGAWRKRATTQSWYNEGASSKRGARKEFPAVAVIVCLSNHIKIYDGDDPNLSLWMDVRGTTAARNKGWMYGSGLNAVTALNGIIAIAANWNIGDEGGLLIMDFIKDELRRYESSAGRSGGQLSISQRGTSANLNTTQYIPPIVDPYVRDVAMTVLPNAPIDASTGLPTPTIAVATGAGGATGGTNIINNNGTVTQGYQTITTEHVDLHPDGYMLDGISGAVNDSYSLYNINETERVAAYGHRVGVHPINTFVNNGTGEILFEGDNNKIAITSNMGLLRIEEELGGYTIGLHNRTTSSYNTGWMLAYVKGAFLSSTDDTDVTGSELLANPGPSFSNTNNWYLDASNQTSGTIATLTISSGRLVFTHSDTNAHWDGFGASFTCTVGEVYVVRADIHSATNMNVLRISNTASQHDEDIAIAGSNDAGVHCHTFTATATTMYLHWNGYTDTSAMQLNSVSVRIAEEDRSSYGNGLQVFGTITKSPVATGAELVAYSGFSSSNHLKQSGSDKILFGTGDFSIIFWAKYATGNNNQSFIDISSTDGGVGDPRCRVHQFHTPAGSIRFYTTDGNVVSTSNKIDAGWTCVAAIRRNSGLEIYINGELEGSGNNSTTNFNNTSGQMVIGMDGDGSDPLNNGSIALVRISEKAPSPEQIKKIYNDEKCLFHENAKCALYGTSDDVKAIAYDDTNEVLHVGTSSGRSEFRGLNRINNTTTAVTTAISASNELVAEQ